MKINTFTIDPIKKIVNIGASTHDNIFVAVNGLRIEGHEGKTVQEVEQHARSEAKRLLLDLAEQL